MYKNINWITACFVFCALTLASLTNDKLRAQSITEIDKRLIGIWEGTQNDSYHTRMRYEFKATGNYEERRLNEGQPTYSYDLATGRQEKIDTMAPMYGKYYTSSDTLYMEYGTGRNSIWFQREYRFQNSDDTYNTVTIDNDIFFRIDADNTVSKSNGNLETKSTITGRWTTIHGTNRISWTINPDGTFYYDGGYGDWMKGTWRTENGLLIIQATDNTGRSAQQSLEFGFNGVPAGNIMIGGHEYRNSNANSGNTSSSISGTQRFFFSESGLTTKEDFVISMFNRFSPGYLQNQVDQYGERDVMKNTIRRIAWMETSTSTGQTIEGVKIWFEYINGDLSCTINGDKP